MSNPTISDQQVIADLRAARSELVTRGRCRGVPVNSAGKVCIVGALGMATIKDFAILDSVKQQQRTYDPRPMSARAVLERHLPVLAENIILWNDGGTTTDQDVLNLFDKALAELGGLA